MTKLNKLSNEINIIKKQKNNIIDELIILLKSNGNKNKEIKLKLQLCNINNILNKKLKQKEHILNNILNNI